MNYSARSRLKKRVLLYPASLSYLSECQIVPGLIAVLCSSLQTCDHLAGLVRSEHRIVFINRLFFSFGWKNILTILRRFGANCATHFDDCSGWLISSIEPQTAAAGSVRNLQYSILENTGTIVQQTLCRLFPWHDKIFCQRQILRCLHCLRHLFGYERVLLSAECHDLRQVLLEDQFIWLHGQYWWYAQYHSQV